MGKGCIYILLLLICGFVAILIYQGNLAYIPIILASLALSLVIYFNWERLCDGSDKLCDKIGLRFYRSLKITDTLPDIVLEKAIIDEHGAFEGSEHYYRRLKFDNLYKLIHDDQDVAIFIYGIICKIADKLRKHSAKYLCSPFGASNNAFGPLIDQQISIQHISFINNIAHPLNKGDKFIVFETYLFNLNHIGKIISYLKDLKDLDIDIVYVMIIFYTIPKKVILRELRSRGIKSWRVCFGWQLEIGKHFAGMGECNRKPSPVNINHDDL